MTAIWSCDPLLTERIAPNVENQARKQSLLVVSFLFLCCFLQPTTGVGFEVKPPILRLQKTVHEPQYLFGLERGPHPESSFSGIFQCVRSPSFLWSFTKKREFQTCKVMSSKLRPVVTPKGIRNPECPQDKLQNASQGHSIYCFDGVQVSDVCAFKMGRFALAVHLCFSAEPVRTEQRSSLFYKRLGVSFLSKFTEFLIKHLWF